MAPDALHYPALALSLDADAGAYNTWLSALVSNVESSFVSLLAVLTSGRQCPEKYP